MPNDILQIITVITGGVVSIIATVSAIFIARRNRQSATVTQFRKVWIDTLTDCLSTFISMAEMISMLDIEREDELYLEYFKELSRMHNKVLLMLNPLEEKHIELSERMAELRDIVHDEEVSDDEFDEMIENKISEILDVALDVLKIEWNVVKAGK